MTIEELVIEVEENKEELEEHEQKFVESLCEYWYKHKRLSEDQEKYLRIYYAKIKAMIDPE